MGMRGDGDEPLTGASIGLVESASWVTRTTLITDITNTQLDILGEVYGSDKVSELPKLWAMYKEVADYYEEGVSGSQLHLCNCLQAAQSPRRW